MPDQPLSDRTFDMIINRFDTIDDKQAETHTEVKDMRRDMNSKFFKIDKRVGLLENKWSYVAGVVGVITFGLLLWAGLGCGQVKSDQQEITWTAPADDGYDPLSGPAQSYVLVWGLDSVAVYASDDGTNGWNPQTGVNVEIGMPIPSVVGSVEAWTLTGLTTGDTIWVSIKAVDEANNWSALGNIKGFILPDVTPPGAIQII